MGGDVALEGVQRQHPPAYRAAAGGRCRRGGVGLGEIRDDVGLAALLADVAAGARTAAGAAALDVDLVEVLAALRVEEGVGLGDLDGAGGDDTGEEVLQPAPVVGVVVGDGVLVGRDVHQREGRGYLGAVVGRGLGGFAALGAGGGRHIALVVVAAGQVPGVGAVHPLVPDEDVGTEVGAGEVAEVEVAVGGGRGGEDEDRPLAEGLALGVLRGGQGAPGIAPVLGEEDEILVAGVLQDVGLEGLEERHRAGGGRMSPPVDDELAAACDDHEELGLVVLMAVGGLAGGDPPPAGARAEALDAAHVDAEGLGECGVVVRVDDHAASFRWDGRGSRSAVSAAMAGPSR
ncbi:hypothetical protein SALBM311S_00192 [Streptomyces alboniger]